MDINDVKNTFVKDVFPVFTKQGWEKYFKPAFTKEGFNRHFAEVVKTMYTNIDFKGRTSRSQYWYFSLYYLILAIAAGILDGILFGGIALLIWFCMPGETKANQWGEPVK